MWGIDPRLRRKTNCVPVIHIGWVELDGPKDFGEMKAVLELARNLDLTDDFAPLDNLLAPVFVSRGEDPDD